MKQWLGHTVKIMVLCIVSWGLLAANASVYILTPVSQKDFEAPLKDISGDIQLKYSREAHRLANRFISDYYFDGEEVYAKSKMLFPLYDHALEASDLPVELKYLSVIESGLLSSARSQSGAGGYWQFLGAIGRHYGLRINYRVDERKDPLRSTMAASLYLKDLYEEFGDWYLALTAYNCGPARVQAAMAASEGNSFREIRDFLPRETRWYIPKFVAANWWMNMRDNMAENEETYYPKVATALVYDYLSFHEISKLSGAALSVIRELNPAYLTGHVPKSARGYYLTLPVQEMYNLLTFVSHDRDVLLSPAVSRDKLLRVHLLSSTRKTTHSLLSVDDDVWYVDGNSFTSMESPFEPPIPMASFRQSSQAYIHSLRRHVYLLSRKNNRSASQVVGTLMTPSPAAVFA